MKRQFAILRMQNVSIKMIIQLEKVLEVLKMEMPYEPEQKFQIGSVCKIIKPDNTFSYPPIKDDEYEFKDRECVILGTYAQMYFGINYQDYSVYLLPTSNRSDYVGSLAWVTEFQLEFVRSADENTRSIVIIEDNKRKPYPHYNSIFNPNKEENGLGQFIQALYEDGCVR